MKRGTILAPVIALVIALSLTVMGIAHTVDNPYSTDLIAGQEIDVGNVSVWNDATNLYVEFGTTDNWHLNETHLAVGTSVGDIPQKNGNPIPGKFEYKNESFTTNHTYAIPLAWAQGEELSIAAQAEVLLLNETGVVVQEESAWGDGADFEGRNWAMYFIYTVQ
jgi:hypothetical protein